MINHSLHILSARPKQKYVDCGLVYCRKADGMDKGIDDGINDPVSVYRKKWRYGGIISHNVVQEDV